MATSTVARQNGDAKSILPTLMVRDALADLRLAKGAIEAHSRVERKFSGGLSVDNATLRSERLEDALNASNAVLVRVLGYLANALCELQEAYNIATEHGTPAENAVTLFFDDSASMETFLVNALRAAKRSGSESLAAGATFMGSFYAAGHTPEAHCVAIPAAPAVRSVNTAELDVA